MAHLQGESVPAYPWSGARTRHPQQAAAWVWTRVAKWFRTESCKSLGFLSSPFHFILDLLTSILFLLRAPLQKPFTRERKVLFNAKYYGEHAVSDIHPLSHKENMTRS